MRPPHASQVYIYHAQWKLGNQGTYVQTWYIVPSLFKVWWSSCVSTSASCIWKSARASIVCFGNLLQVTLASFSTDWITGTTCNITTLCDNISYCAYKVHHCIFLPQMWLASLTAIARLHLLAQH